MNTETEYLQTIAEEIAAQTKETLEPISKADLHLVNEAKRLEKFITQSLTVIENFTQRDTYHYNTLSKLVKICDLLYDTTNSVNPNVVVLLDLMAAVRQVIPTEIRPNLKLSKAFIDLRKEKFSKSWLHHNGLMAKYNVPAKLIIIAGIPFKRFTEPKGHLFWGDYTWLRGYQAKLDILDWENADCNSPAEALLSLLIGRDFNDDRFFIYCKKYVTDRLKDVTGKLPRVQEYAQCEKLVLEDTQIGMPSFDARANSVSSRLIKWIHEEIDFVETHERDQLHVKFEFKWSAEMIAFFFKLLHERKVFGNIKLDCFSEVIAANCTSIDKEEIQASTIYSRFYKKDINLIKAIEKILRDILDDLGNFLH